MPFLWYISRRNPHERNCKPGTNGTAAAQQENRTFTQDEVNAIVADRLTRERAKYADYDDLKGKAGRADEADSVPLHYSNSLTP